MASCFFFRRKVPLQGSRRLVLLLGVLVLMSLGITACGGGFPGGNQATTYTINVTGTNASDQHSTTVTLTVQ
jgi:ABC-type glycerol-3-phosphate transport system substrate-binding protein